MFDASLEIHKAIRSLFLTLLPPGEEGSPTEIIAGHQRAVAKMPYLVISRPSYRQIGLDPFVKPVEEHIVEGVGDAPDTYTYTEDRVTTYVGRATITEVGGSGNMIRHVFSRLSDPDVRTLLYNLKLSISDMGDPVHMPQIQGNGYIDEFTTDIRFNFAISHTIDTEIVETVDFGSPEVINNVIVVPSL